MDQHSLHVRDRLHHFTPWPWMEGCTDYTTKCNQRFITYKILFETTAYIIGCWISRQIMEVEIGYGQIKNERFSYSPTCWRSQSWSSSFVAVPNKKLEIVRSPFQLMKRSLYDNYLLWTSREGGIYLFFAEVLIDTQALLLLHIEKFSAACSNVSTTSKWLMVGLVCVERVRKLCVAHGIAR